MKTWLMNRAKQVVFGIAIIALALGVQSGVALMLVALLIGDWQMAMWFAVVGWPLLLIGGGYIHIELVHYKLECHSRELRQLDERHQKLEWRLEQKSREAAEARKRIRRQTTMPSLN